jgi:methylenetetrahydrofolate dehydrogenase (NADP+) / methenyltetrahydrofolate cyclohydrolase
MQLLDGKKLTAEMKQEIASEVAAFKAAGGKTPHLAAILVGHDGGSETYVAGKVKACAEVGIKSTLVRFEEQVTEKELLLKIAAMNDDADIDGLIVQLPLPPHIAERHVIEAIDIRKDVDGFHPMNIGRMVIGIPSYLSATPAGILEILKRYNIPTAGKSCVVVGRSNIVGKPVSILLSRKGYPGDATVTLCHSRTVNLKDITQQADILIAAMGKPEFIRADMVKEGAVVIDVGITRIKSEATKSGWKLIGDVKFDEVAPHCSYITPVPGGVGLLTVVALLKNTLLSAKKTIYP